MSNRELKDCERANSAHKESEAARYIGAIILLVAAGVFLLLVFGLNSIFDFSRFAY